MGEALKEKERGWGSYSHHQPISEGWTRKRAGASSKLARARLWDPVSEEPNRDETQHKIHKIDFFPDTTTHGWALYTDWVCACMCVHVCHGLHGGWTQLSGLVSGKCLYCLTHLVHRPCSCFKFKFKKWWKCNLFWVIVLALWSLYCLFL